MQQLHLPLSLFVCFDSCAEALYAESDCLGLESAEKYSLRLNTYHIVFQDQDPDGSLHCQMLPLRCMQCSNGTPAGRGHAHNGTT